MPNSHIERSLSLPSSPGGFARDRFLERLTKRFSGPLQRILLINPPQMATKDFIGHFSKKKRYFGYPPYGLGLLSRGLHKKGYTVDLLDLNLEILQHSCNLVVGGGDTVHADIDITSWMRPRLVEHLLQFQPDAVGISCMFTMTHARMLEIAKIVRESRPNVLIMVGGVHPTSSAQTVLEESRAVDLVALYESDTSLPDFFDAMNGRIPMTRVRQIATLIDGTFVQVDDRQLPTPQDMDYLPDYVGLPLDRYSEYGEVGSYRFWWRSGTRAATVLSNRGCRARCTFCGVRNFNGRGVRSRSCESVVDEIADIKNRYGINHIMWLDDDLFYDKKRAIRLFNTLEKCRLDITWDASNGVIPSATTYEVLDAAAASGCIGLHFGVESGNSERLRLVRKPSGVKHYLALRDKLLRHPGIFTKGFLMVGFPGETIGEILDTVRVAVEMDLDWYTVQMLTPLPGTDTYQQMVDMGLVEEDGQKHDAANYGTSHTGRQYKREQQGKEKAAVFQDPFSRDLDFVPGPEDMDDIWFLADYRINYERILHVQDPKRLAKWRVFLQDVSNRITRDNPLVHYFLAVIERRLGNLSQEQVHRRLSEVCLRESAYWRQRFQILELGGSVGSHDV